MSEYRTILRRSRYPTRTPLIVAIIFGSFALLTAFYAEGVAVNAVFSGLVLGEYDADEGIAMGVITIALIPLTIIWAPIVWSGLRIASTRRARYPQLPSVTRTIMLMVIVLVAVIPMCLLVEALFLR